jgi:hypothetical protein
VRYKPYQPPYTIPEVLQMRAEGKTYSEIGNHFGISRPRVGQLINREKQRQQSAERRKVILNGIRGSNDIDRKLPLEDMFCVLSLSRRAGTCLRGYFSLNHITEFSLRDMMDFLLPLVDVEADYIEHLPALRVKTKRQGINHAQDHDPQLRPL